MSIAGPLRHLTQRSTSRLRVLSHFASAPADTSALSRACASPLTTKRRNHQKVALMLPSVLKLCGQAARPHRGRAKAFTPAREPFFGLPVRQVTC